MLWTIARSRQYQLRYVHARLGEFGEYQDLDMIADPDDPRDLFGMILRAQGASQS